MFFRGIPESQFLSDKSKFVYSEDDEHLTYISRQNLYRNIGKMMICMFIFENLQIYAI